MNDEFPQLSAPADVGGHVVLALLNTVVDEDGRTVDHLADDATAFAWLLERGFMPEPLSSAPRALAPALRDAREMIRHAFNAMIAGHVPDVTELNGVLARGIGHWHLSTPANKSHLDLHFDRREAGAIAAVTSLAEAAAALLASGAAHQVKRCANPACTMMFIDATATRRRRWCDMARCGNRMKVNTFRARTRNQS